MLENRLKIMKDVYITARVLNNLYTAKSCDKCFYQKNKFDFDVLEDDGMIAIYRSHSDDEIEIGLTVKGVHFVESHLTDEEKEEIKRINRLNPVNTDGEFWSFGD